MRNFMIKILFIKCSRIQGLQTDTALESWVQTLFTDLNHCSCTPGCEYKALPRSIHRRETGFSTLTKQKAVCSIVT